ncbi:hypothetical protein DICSQDRAFT_165719 [Dichomitus squalens LYAD-421 SS1]|uniref:uncharacterized protein n=1 Tax=Dichomitus squalens (strain LYAD-421) TaxID=732165 RepID=UPI00044129F3|nr:uncharacterized protein DICSQDRAFT_165719 [Dichomitus squalens LYAD-421 SS1]EJF66021.1 hypothetical protein DICSQDRAFT_165719 [Dichomitus squalens LYAD-421 SS1]
MKSDAQRTRAVETVDAYCVAHHLHLVALVVLPSSVSSPHAAKTLQSIQEDLHFGVSAWCEVLRECLVEPVSLVQDYVDTLTAASGRVVMVLSSDHQPWPASLHELQDRTLLSTAQYLRRVLEPLGIRVSTVSTGPSAPATASSTTFAEAR